MSVGVVVVCVCGVLRADELLLFLCLIVMVVVEGGGLMG